jgi:two-component system, OmpR family, sensor kinase
VNRWWQRRSLRFRLALWYAAATALVLIAFAWFVYEVIEHRLAAEIDRQLRIDFDLVEAQLDIDAGGGVRWALRGSHGDEGFARISAWFEVWSENRELLLRHWPVAEADIKDGLDAPHISTLKFATVELEPDLFVRVMERPARVQGRGVVLRLFRDETEMRRTLREVVEVSVLGLPLAIALASIGGYLIARRSLAPLDAMTRQARRITSESLSERLPNPNPSDELGGLATVFNETLTRLEASFAELQRFTADASHELRSPLTALRAVGEVALRDGDDSTVLRETIGSMLEEAQRLTDLVDALLTLARMDATKTGFAREEVNIAGLLEELRDQFEVLAAEKRQMLALTCDHDLSVQADRTLLRLALVNLLHNAIQHSPPDSNIALAAARRPSGIEISVSDTGLGIAVEHHEKIFERFFRIDKARSRSGAGGVGLGLAIAKRAVERNGGRIIVESDWNRGSVFRIELPSERRPAGNRPRIT